jgi:hypothetical protein
MGTIFNLIRIDAKVNVSNKIEWRKIDWKMFQIYLETWLMKLMQQRKKINFYGLISYEF